MDRMVGPILDNDRDSLLYGTMEDERNIILTGYRATGKSSIGIRLAAAAGMEFLDMDRVIEQRQGCTIREMVAARGWPYFRSLERELLEELAGRKALVIATGGGAVMHRESWARLQATGLVVWLTADRRTICRRLAADAGTQEQRPPLTGGLPEAEIDLVLAEREPLYREGSHLAVDTSGKNPEEIIRIIMDSFRRGRD